MILLLACSGASDVKDPVEKSGLAILGYESHELDSITRDVIATGQDGLKVPLDLEFNPEAPGELWVVNQKDDSVTILFDAGTDAQTSTHIIDPYALHFMDAVTAIAFGATGTFGTTQESRNNYGQGQGNDFMGPTLWSSDLEIFGQSNPEAIEYLTELFGFYTDLGSHLDMLHESPLAMGMAWSHDNVYWVYDGFNESIYRYDFQEDHGIGYDDHSDGIMARWVEGEIGYVEGTPSHLEYEQSTGFLYIADTENGVVRILDTNSGEQGDNLPKAEPGTKHYTWVGADMWTFVDGELHGLGKPSGLALTENHLFVTDAATGNLFAFDLEGNLVDWVNPNMARIAGVEAVSDEELWLVDADRNQVVRLTP
ncbi:MAG: hypothetical protein GY913_20940 [Proteobacteria bacterium]|nr:hypothetical protein [Pseudomonadota bacterium]MCP4919374.1 hypothetical protein [Pseudomonadota bacterium]